METRNCQNCKNDFQIVQEDFDFYNKIKVPPPTFCPDCRMVRRMNWRNERSLFKRECAKTGKQLITMFHPESNVVVYDRDIWWSDEWEPTEFGQEYDFSRPFFEQFKELLSVVPLANVGNTNVVNSPYGNHNAECKDCYLLYGSWKGERVSYSRGALDVKDSYDLSTVEKSEQCYGDLICTGLYNTHFSYNTDESFNSYFLDHCINVQDSIGCINLRSRQNCIFNQQYSKEEYAEKKKEYDFGSYAVLADFKKRFNEFTLQFPHKYANIIKSVNFSGDNGMTLKNAYYCFDAYGDVENAKYVAHVVGLKDGYDGYGFGAGSTMMYEGIDSGLKAANQYFAVLAHGNFDTQYVYMCYNSKNLFGCIGLRKKQYCILNKQYTKEEYEMLVPKIIEHMKQMPYVDVKGRVYSYGEFFPTELSPFAYNETIAQEYFPLSRHDILDYGYLYREHVKTEYAITKQSEELPDHINDVTDAITQDIIACPNQGNDLTQCTVAYRIIPEELAFLRRHQIALPRYCPNCRHYERLAKRNPLKLWPRTCMCQNPAHDHEGKCPNQFETSYSPDRPEIVYCESCYQKEVL